MPFIPSEDVINARKMDLVTYLRTYEPAELVKVSGDIYCTREHDSLHMSNGKWFWFSKGIGGANALEYLIKVKGMTFIEAVRNITEKTGTATPVFYYAPKPAEKRLLLPKANENTDIVEQYLLGRGIHPNVLKYCLEKGLVYESEQYHNAVFVGKDRNGKPRYAAVRSTNTRYKGDATGSDKHFSFSICESEKPESIHLFEAAIDLLSFASLYEMRGKCWRDEALLSLAGVYQTKRDNVVPVALKRFLTDYPSIRTVYLHLDNDEVGRKATQGIMSGLADRCRVVDQPPAWGKDVNDELRYRIKRQEEKDKWTRSR